MKNINDLRDILFSEIENVKSNPTEENLARANSVNSLAQSLIGIAKAEIDFTKTTGGLVDSGFIKPEPVDNKQRNLQALPYGREKTGRKW